MKPTLHALFVTLALTTLACDIKHLGVPTPGANPEPPGFNPQPDPPGFNPQPDPPGAI